jgi:hypothetical protein
LPACGSATSDPLACGPQESATLIFGYHHLGGAAPNANVLTDNGGEYLFVDTACRYWAFKGDFDTAAGYWTDVKTGRLTSEELQEFNRDVLEQPWSSYAGESAPIPGQYLHAHWYLADASNCFYEGCSQAALAHSDTARAWLNRLYAAGTPFESLPLRVEVIAIDRSNEEFTEWTGDAVLSEMVRSPAEANRDGGHPFVNDSDSALIREVRERFRIGLSNAFTDQFLSFTSDGSMYGLYARQTIPYEDAEGLIRAPSGSP